jgi:hypothetical protein
MNTTCRSSARLTNYWSELSAQSPDDYGAKEKLARSDLNHAVDQQHRAVVFDRASVGIVAVLEIVLTEAALLGAQALLYGAAKRRLTRAERALRHAHQQEAAGYQEIESYIRTKLFAAGVHGQSAVSALDGVKEHPSLTGSPGELPGGSVAPGSDADPTNIVDAETVPDPADSDGRSQRFNSSDAGSANDDGSGPAARPDDEWYLGGAAMS